jgi:anti-sigma factor RsiW
MIMMETVENWALHAFADGELDGDEKKTVEKLLAENEEARKALTHINHQKSELRRTYDGVLDEPIPAALLAATKRSTPRRILPYLVAASAAMLFFTGGSLGWYAAQNSESLQSADLAHRAYVAHETYAVEVRHPVEVAASEQDHLQAWLSKRVGMEMKIPDLSAEGYNLLGGRLVAENDAPAGQLMYETADKQRLTVFLSNNVSGKEEALRLVQNGNLITCYWRDGKLAMAVTGDMPRDAMMALAKDIYEQMDAKG